MGLPAKLVHSQLNFFKPLVASCSLETIRRGQDKLGELMEAIHKKDVKVRDHPFDRFEGAWVIPRDERRQGVILYLHGGGYTCGDLDYAKGFAATLADEEGVRVFCAAYRLAPEHPFPAALDDALSAVEEITDITTLSYAYRDEIHTCMHTLRVSCDEAETITADKYWPFPTYDRLLFGV